uniref:Replication factor A C-terminal domain-containing protein n=1 Tax=Chenopodium quinoa TaxID=63459 RepID=A0A803LHX7_CHEQI
MENEMRGTLFEDDIENFKTVLEHQKEYIISDAPIRNTNPMFRHKEDILGVIVHLEDTRKKKTSTGYEFDVRDIVVVDASVQRMADALVISVYGELATKECAKLASWCESFLVVSFRHLKAATHGGFSLVSSMSTIIDPDPAGPEVSALKAWVIENEDRLADHVAHQLQSREASISNVLTSVEDLKKKTPLTTTAHERHWLKITIPTARKEDIIAYVGCSVCGNHCDNVEATKFYCDKCNDTCTTEKRVSITFYAADDIATIRLTAYGKQCEKLLGLKEAELIEKKISGWDGFDKLAAALKGKPVKVEVGPTSAIKRVGYLKWVIKTVVPEEPVNAKSVGTKEVMDAKSVATKEVMTAKHSCSKRSQECQISCSKKSHECQEPRLLVRTRYIEQE